MKDKDNVSRASSDSSEKKENLFIHKYNSMMNESVEIAIFVLVTVFPLIFHNAYYDILGTKYRCYTLCILVLGGAVLFLSLFMMGLDFKNFHGSHTKSLLSRLHPRNWKTVFCAADAMVLVFWLTALISTLQSKFTHEAFWGNEGRYSGLFLLTLYVISYFLISRFWTLNGHLFDLFLASGMIMCVFGITDYFQMDILNFRGNDPSSIPSFTSTIGNINTYTAYVGMLLGFAAAMFVFEKTVRRAIWYYICIVISLIAIILGRSDNAYLSLAAIFIFLPFVLFNSKKGVWKYLVLLATFFTAIQTVCIVNQLFADRVLGINSLFRIIEGFKGLPFLILALWASVVIFGVYCWKHEKKESLISEYRINLVHVWAGFMLIAFLAVCLLFFDANRGGQEEKYAALSSYLIFNDKWGSGRGYVWKKSLWLYNRLTPMGKLFGCGPDTFGCLVNKTIVFQMQNDTGMFFDNAHNSFLHYLVTIGLLGLTFYLLFLAASFIRLFRNRQKNPYILGTLLAVMCYISQSLVNLDVPIVTPTMWLLISMGMAGCRNTQHPK